MSDMLDHNPSLESGEEDCGCAERQAWLNNRVPGLGDAVKVIAEPVADMTGIYGRKRTMPDILRPDMKSLVWLAIGTLVVARFVRL